jgi:hypothetical protein
VEGYGGFDDFLASGPGIDYASLSSRRWKTDIRNIDEPLKKLLRLRGVYFTWDQDHGSTHDIGFIAEEVGRVLPEVVDYEENGQDAIGMDYSKVTPLLVEAFNTFYRDYTRELAQLRAENDNLNQRIDFLESKIQATCK